MGTIGKKELRLWIWISIGFLLFLLGLVATSFWVQSGLQSRIPAVYLVKDGASEPALDVLTRLANGSDFSAWESQMLALLEYEDATPTPWEEYDPEPWKRLILGDEKTLWLGSNPILLSWFLSRQGLLSVLQGDYEESLPRFASIYRHGQIVNLNGSFVNRLDGATQKSIAIDSLAYTLRYGCSSVEAVDMLWENLEQLNKLARHDAAKHFFDGEDVAERIVYRLMDPIGDVDLASWTREADIRFKLLRAAAAAKRHYLTTGAPPASEQDFAPYFPRGLPKDSFGRGAVRFVEKPSGEFILYSVGPDGVDDGARKEFSWDVSNPGQEGDIILIAFAKSDRIIPREGIQARTKEELLKLLPESKLTEGLQIRDRSTTQRLAVYFVGPDYEDNFGQITYDPTNGYKSAGDMILEIGSED